MSSRDTAVCDHHSACNASLDEAQNLFAKRARERWLRARRCRRPSWHNDCVATAREFPAQFDPLHIVLIVPTSAPLRFSFALFAVLEATPLIARAQAPKKTLAASAVVNGTFSVSAGALVQNTQQANPCNPGACYDAATNVHANRSWQLQVTLSETPANFYVNWIQKPQNAQVRLNAGAWQTIASGTTSTPSQALSSMYNANKTTAKGGFIPTAAQLAAVLSYRVIANP